MRGVAARLATLRAAMIRIDQLWLAVEPLDMRAGAQRLLARVVPSLRLGPGPPRLPVRQRTGHPHQVARARRLRRVVRRAARERRALRVAATGAWPPPQTTRPILSWPFSCHSEPVARVHPPVHPSPRTGMPRKSDPHPRHPPSRRMRTTLLQPRGYRHGMRLRAASHFANGLVHHCCSQGVPS